MKVKVFAKINLALDIVGKLDNGYHEIESIFQTVSIYDDVTVELTDDNIISLTCEVPEEFKRADTIPTDSRNIAYRTARKFFQDNNLEKGCRIHIKKRIPSQAGMGGGSADAGAVLYCLNRLTGGEIISPEKLGADVPFFLTGGTAYVSGIGEKIERIQNWCGKTLVIAKGKECVSTAEAYRKTDEFKEHIPLEIKAMHEAISRGENISRYVGNIFENAIHLKEVEDIKSEMNEFGAEVACMTGSGSAVFGIFQNVGDAEFCANRLVCKKYWAEVCTATDKAIEEI